MRGGIRTSIDRAGDDLILNVEVRGVESDTVDSSLSEDTGEIARRPTGDENGSSGGGDVPGRHPHPGHCPANWSRPA